VNQHYEKYIARGVARKNHNSIALNEACRKHFVNYRSVAGFNIDVKSLAHTLHFKSAQGAYLTDLDDNRYLDISMGFGVFLFGHNPEFFKKAIRDTLDSDHTALGPLSHLAPEVAAKIQMITGVERSAFFNSGTEAIMVAIRLARAATKKKKIVQFKGAYHGTVDSTLVFKVNSETHVGLPLIPGITEDQLGETILLEYGTDEALAFILANAHEIAGVLTEPVQSRNPSLQPAGFLKRLRAITEENNIALIFDEIVTGFRIHLAGAQHYFGVPADVVAYGKIVGGGMPIGVVCGNAYYMNFIDGGDWKYDDNSAPEDKRTFVAGTFCQHPLSMATAKALLDELIRQGPRLQSELNDNTRAFAERMNHWFECTNIPIHIHYCASWFRFTLPSKARHFYDHLLLEGIYIWEGRNCFLSTAHTIEDIRLLETKIKKAALLLKAFGLKSTTPVSGNQIAWTVSEQTNYQLCATNADFDNACQIGIDLRLSKTTPELLKAALHFVLLHHFPAKAMITPDGLYFGSEVTSHIEFIDVQEWDPHVSNLINRPLRESSGLAVLIGLADNCVTHVAFASHKLVFDGYSLSIIVHQLVEVLRALNEGNALPSLPLRTMEEYESERKQINFIEPVTEPRAYKIKIIRRRVAVHYIVLKKFLRASRVTLYDLVQQTLHENFGLKDFGRPRAMQLSQKNHHLSGSFTTIEYLETGIPHTDAVIVNVDKAIGSQQQYITELFPLNPEHAKYKLVINVLVANDHLLIDYKYCPAFWNEEDILALHDLIITRLFNDLA
jgi:glutamate-1-semialdehyde aminotransferase